MALWFPRLPTDRLQRRWTRQDAQQAHTDCARSPDAANEAPPLVVVAKIDNAMRLTAVDRKATSLGLCAGMTLADARAMLPALKVMAANEPADQKLLEQIAEWCDRYTPFVALDPPHALLLGCDGCRPSLRRRKTPARSDPRRSLAAGFRGQGRARRNGGRCARDGALQGRRRRPARRRRKGGCSASHRGVAAGRGHDPCLPPRGS